MIGRSSLLSTPARCLAVVALAALVGACGSDTSPPPSDGGSVIDGGARLDGGSAFDGGGVIDGGATDGGGLDGGVAFDGGALDGGPPLGAPIDAAPRTWTWIDFADSTCDEGTPTGIGINKTDASANVLIYFNGGGACWDYSTCVVLNTSAHGPYGAGQFAATAGALPNAMIFNRANAQNPFKDYNYVFVPYCTGDLHGGNNVANYTNDGGAARTIRHKGRANIEAFMKRIGATFPSPAKVAVVGPSAGGFGAILNYRLIRAYWPNARGYMIDDSGPFLSGDGIPATLRAAWGSAWNLYALTDTYCSCQSSLSSIYGTTAQSFRDDRFALLSYLQDSVIRNYFMMTATNFEAALRSLDLNELSAQTNFRSFFATGTSHTMLINGAAVTVGGTTLIDWLRAMVTDADWNSAISP